MSFLTCADEQNWQHQGSSEVLGSSLVAVNAFMAGLTRN